ncbi:MAG TPA: hypothetical protein VMU09_00140 [Acidimicrobiales bacterium]|nr:hypothetical protein [Acidimicrobiales bacterium]
MSSGKKAKGVAAGVGLVGTVVSIWWFALRPRRKRKKAAGGE